MIKRLLIVLGYYHIVHLLKTSKELGKGFCITQLKIQVYILHLTYFQQSCNVTLIFFSQGTIQTMREELTKPDFSLLRLTKKLCHKGPLWQSVSIVQVHVLGEQGMAQW